MGNGEHHGHHLGVEGLHLSKGCTCRRAAPVEGLHLSKGCTCWSSLPSTSAGSPARECVGAQHAAKLAHHVGGAKTTPDHKLQHRRSSTPGMGRNVVCAWPNKGNRDNSPIEDNTPGAEATPQNKGDTMHRTWKVGIRTAMILGVLSIFSVSCARAAPADNDFTVQATTAELATIDLGPPGPSQGDEYIFSTTIARDGRPFGTGNAVCTRTRSANANDFTIQCLVSFRFPQGNIAAQAVIDGVGGRYMESINGGTGIYRDARGEVLVVAPPGASVGTVVDLTFHLAEH
jgi:hypothetical protein